MANLILWNRGRERERETRKNHWALVGDNSPKGRPPRPPFNTNPDYSSLISRAVSTALMHLAAGVALHHGNDVGVQVTRLKNTASAALSKPDSMTFQLQVGCLFHAGGLENCI